MKVIAFGASHSKHSINKKFATYTANQFAQHDIEIVDLNDYELPTFTVDREMELGHPDHAKCFADKLASADLIIVSMAEHNGSYTASFKNLFDWTSRYRVKMFESKKLILISTSPGGRGGVNALEAAKIRFPIHGAEIIGTFSLPSFNDNFNENDGITAVVLNQQFEEFIRRIKQEHQF